MMHTNWRRPGRRPAAIHESAEETCCPREGQSHWRVSRGGPTGLFIPPSRTLQSANRNLDGRPPRLRDGTDPVRRSGLHPVSGGFHEAHQGDQNEEYFWREREAGRLVRSVQLPAMVYRANVTAVYHDGIMTIRLPKAETGAKARIPIK